MRSICFPLSQTICEQNLPHLHVDPHQDSLHFPFPLSIEDTGVRIGIAQSLWVEFPLLILLQFLVFLFRPLQILAAISSERGSCFIPKAIALSNRSPSFTETLLRFPKTSIEIHHQPDPAKREKGQEACARPLALSMDSPPKGFPLFVLPLPSTECLRLPFSTLALSVLPRILHKSKAQMTHSACILLSDHFRYRYHLMILTAVHFP